jgi:hypothetical protein
MPLVLLTFGRSRRRCRRACKNDCGENGAQLKKRPDGDARGPELHRRARSCIQHPPREIAGHPRQLLDAHHLLATHALPQHDDYALPMQRVPPVVDRPAVGGATVGACFDLTGSVCSM